MPKKKVKTKAKAKVKPRRKTINKLFPGLPNYVGPQRGYFAFVHHAKLYERASEDMSNRVEYIRTMKPAAEVPIRLRHLIYLGPRLSKRCKDQTYLTLGYDATRAAVLAYAKKHIKPLHWNGRTLTLANGRNMTG